MLGALSFRDVQEKSLVCRDHAGRFPHSNGRFHGRTNFAVGRAQFEFEIRHGAVIVEQFFKPFAILRIHVQRRDIEGKKRFTGRVATNALERVVKIKKSALRGRNKNAFLNVRNERAILFFSAFAVRDVLQNVDRSQLAPARIGKCGIRREKIARQPRIGVVPFAGAALAIGTILVAKIFLRE